ncbi:MAG: xanthine dehydrogenase family protein subunit M [Actinomycetia bacterium]|nr:xanthine dehydrogenase family protein subunit M [Actinomycetes bacterium]
MKYQAPTSIEEAVALLDSNPGARVFAGATDLIPQFQGGRPEPSKLVDLKGVPQTGVLECQNGYWRVGARLTSHRELVSGFPGLVEGTSLIGSDQIQGRATLGGNLCNASPAADSVPPLVALGATAVIVGPAGRRSVPVSEIVIGPGATSLHHAEFITEFRIPVPARGCSDAYERFIPRTEMDIAVVGAAARIRLDDQGRCRDATVVLGAVAPTVVEVSAAAEILRGRQLAEASNCKAFWEELGEAAAASCNPIDDKRGTVEFRRRVAGVLARRTVATAARRAKEAV